MIADTKGEGPPGLPSSAVLGESNPLRSGLRDHLSGEVGQSLGARVVGQETLRFSLFSERSWWGWFSSDV